MSLYCIDEFKGLNKRLDNIEKKLDDVIPIDHIQRLVKEIRELL